MFFLVYKLLFDYIFKLIKLFKFYNLYNILSKLEDQKILFFKTKHILYLGVKQLITI